MRITFAFIIALCVYGGAYAEYVPGPTTGVDNQPVIVVGEDPAVLSGVFQPTLDEFFSLKDDPVFPQSYIQGDHYLAWKIDTATGEVTQSGAGPKPGLIEAAQNAINKAPPWLRTALVDRFLDMSDDDAAIFADLILNPEEQRFTDELAFLVAMTGSRDINYDRSADLMEENVRLIYEYDEYLDYVSVVDHGTPEDDDYWTTVEYTALVDGAPTTFESPKEIYYWYIVHPKLDMERIEYVDPTTGATRDPEDGGRFWRDYLWTSGDGLADYTRPYFLLNPTEITEAELQGWGDTATSYFNARDIYNIDAVLHENGEPVLVEFSYGAGTVVATTMNVEAAAAQSHVMDNLLAYGCGDMTLPVSKEILILDDEAGKNENAETLWTALSGAGYENVNYVYYGDFPDNLPGDLTLDDVDKVIIPSNSAHEAYEIFADGDPTEIPVLSWLRGGYRVLEIHMANTADLSDITLLGGYKVAAPGSATDTATIAGRPLLSQVIAAADHVWDGVVYESLSGDRSFAADGTMALRILGNWLGKNTMDNISEWREKYNASSVERAIEPVRIVYNHFGNCGEMQDLWTAAARTCLIPVMNVSDTNEDHVWNEFYHDGAWYYLQDDWSNAATRIATPGGKQDSDYCGENCGKTTSFIFRWDGNGEIVSVIERYSQYITVEFEITDAAGQPVPGAKISLASEGYYEPHFKNLSFFVFTDADGKAAVTLGDLRNYYARVDSGAGSYPDETDNHYSTIVTDVDAVGGSSFTWVKAMPEVMQGDIAVAGEAKGEGLHGMHLSFDLHQRFQHLVHDFNAVEFTRYPENKGLNVYLVDEENFADCRSGGLEYTVQKAWESVTNFDEEIFPPGDGNPWYVIISNRTNPESVMTMDLTTAEAAENPNPTDDDADDDADDDDLDDDLDDDINNADDDLSSEASAKEDDDEDGACGC